MVDEFYTLILVPGARSAPRKIRIPLRMLRRGRAATAVLALVAASLLAHYTWLNTQMSAIAVLRAENAALAEQARQYSRTLGQLESQVDLLQRTVTKLGVISGVERTLPDVPGVAGGMGGVTGVESSPPSREAGVLLHSLSRSLNELAERSTRIESFYAGRATLLSRTPSIWPVRGYLSSGFGSRRDPFTGQNDFHPGIDISAPRGTRVIAPADGVVLAAGVRGAYGKAIIIDHGHEVVTRYGHLEVYNVRPGQRVRRGDVIGFVGSTGRSNAPHLHYEVWARDRAQNPIHYILDEYRSFG